MTIRPAVPADIPSMHRVRMSVRENRLADPALVQLHHYEWMLQSGRGWVCEADGSIVGFAIANGLERTVWALFVEPAFEGRGIGRRLHDAMAAWFFASDTTPVSLTTDADTRAERFYRAAGWTRVARQPNGEVRYELRPSARRLEEAHVNPVTRQC